MARPGLQISDSGTQHGWDWWVGISRVRGLEFLQILRTQLVGISILEIRGESYDTPLSPLDGCARVPAGEYQIDSQILVHFMLPSRDTDVWVWVWVSSSADNVVASSGSIQSESRC